MLVIAAGNLLINISSLVFCVLYQPVPYVTLFFTIVTILYIVYVEKSKKYLLVDQK
jgi:hypothetical protein